MSTQTRMTMENPLYGAQRVLFQSVRPAHHKRTSVLRRLIETVFGRRSDASGAPPDVAKFDRVSWISSGQPGYGRPFQSTLS